MKQDKTARVRAEGEPAIEIDEKLLEQLYQRSKASGWRVAREQFRQALETSATRAFPGGPAARELARYLTALHLEDLALACACAAADEQAWEHFIREYRPLLYRAADAIEPGGGARDLADSLYGDLFGLDGGAGGRKSLFRYFHGRSSLITWLRAVIAQRYIDRVRRERRTESLPDEESPHALSASVESIEPERERYVTIVHDALKRAIASLTPPDRLRLACYYGQQLTLAQTGRILGEHEATASRGLARTRARIRVYVEKDLRDREGLGPAEIRQCFECVTDDAGSLDLSEVLDSDRAVRRKTSAVGRSN